MLIPASYPIERLRSAENFSRKLAAACKANGGTTYTGSNGRYGCIVEHDDGWSDSITCTRSGCFHERWPAVVMITTTPKPITVTPITGPARIGSVLGR